MNRHALITALARHSGQTLTVDIGAAIVRELFPIQPIDISGFVPIEHGPYVIRAERFADVVSELHLLHLAHWQETEAYRHGVGLAPDYSRVIELESAGKVLQVTLRLQGRLVGHLRMYLVRSLHTGELVASEDALYIAPEGRDGSMVSVAVTRYTEDCCRALGVREIQFTAKHRPGRRHENGADPILRRLRYGPVGTLYVKVLDPSTPLPAAAPGAQHGELTNEESANVF